MQAQQLHTQSETLRESGNFLEALKLADEALLAYAQENNIAGMAEVQCSRFLVLRHLSTEFPQFLIIAKHAVLSAVELAKSSQAPSSLVIPLFNLAKYYEEIKDYPNAITYYQDAIVEFQKNPPSQHNRPSVLVDFQIHLNDVQLAAGDLSAADRLLKLIDELRELDEPKFNKDVWISGAHMHLAESLFATDQDRARHHLQLAKEIIEADPDLTIRLTQWQQLAQKIQ